MLKKEFLYVINKIEIIQKKKVVKMSIGKVDEFFRYGLFIVGALLIKFIISQIMSFYAVFVECSMYMKTGTKIRNKNIGRNKNYRKIKQK